MFNFFSNIFNKIAAFFTSILVFLGIIPAPVVPQVKMTPVYQIAAIDNFRTVQGSCTDGKYVYISMISNVNNPDGRTPCKLIKVDTEKWETTLISENKYIDHANDMTYIDHAKSVYVVNNAPNYNNFTVVDPETLKITATGKRDYLMYGMEYIPQTDCYYFGVSSTYDLMVMNAQTSETQTLSLVNNGYTRQGISSDGEYIYCLYSDPNIIYKYDFNGVLQGKMELPIKENEAESLFFINSVMYVTYNIPGVGNGGVIYKVEDEIYS